MTSIPAPPPGFTVLPVPGDPPGPADPAALRYRGPDGTVYSAAEVAALRAQPIEEQPFEFADPDPLRYEGQ